MANIVNALVRFYPVDGQLNKECFNTIYGKLKKYLWRSWYYFNEVEGCIDVIYPGKYPITDDLYQDEEMLQHYHIWVRVADFSCYEDLIGFKSKTYRPELRSIDQKCRYQAEFTDDWNYASSCLYRADELQIKFNSNDNSFLKRLILEDSADRINDVINPDLIWSHSVMMVYMKSSQTIFDNDFTGEHIEKNYYQSELNWANSHLWDIMLNDHRIKFRAAIFDPLHNNNINIGLPLDLHAVDEITFKSNGRCVYRLKRTEKECKWKEGTSSDWDHCVDPEFITFRTWYKNKTGNYVG